jgi:hypothetical protein
MLWMLFGLAFAEPTPELPGLELDGNKVLIDGERKPLTRARVYLIADRGSRPMAQKAKRTGALGSVLAGVGAGMIVIGAAAANEQFEAGVGSTILGAGVLTSGAIFKARSFSRWKKSVADYEQVPYAAD